MSGYRWFSPSPYYTPDVASWVEHSMIRLTVEAMNREGRTFRGVLYFGLMLTPDGPRVLEYNARFGDPEAQVVLPRLKSDLLEIMEAITEKRLDKISIEWEKEAAVCVVAASGGYPGRYKKGLPIHGLEQAEKEHDILLFHAGTKRTEAGLVTDGGRVLGVTALGDTAEDAAEKAYRQIGAICFQDMQYRKDIGTKKTEREKEWLKK